MTVTRWRHHLTLNSLSRICCLNQYSYGRNTGLNISRKQLGILHKTCWTAFADSEFRDMRWSSIDWSDESDNFGPRPFSLSGVLTPPTSSPVQYSVYLGWEALYSDLRTHSGQVPSPPLVFRLAGILCVARATCWYLFRHPAQTFIEGGLTSTPYMLNRMPADEYVTSIRGSIFTTLCVAVRYLCLAPTLLVHN